MNSNPLVSIITIVYNRVHTLERAILSVVKQSYPNIEYIIIDGGSTDGSVDIIKKFGDKISFWTSEKDQGIADAFNKGINKAKGEVIGLVNADDWLEPDAVEHVVRRIQNVDIVYGNMQCWDNGVKTHLFTANHQLLHLQMTINHPATFVRRQCYLDYGTFDLAYKCAMDYELMLRFYLLGASFLYTNKVLSNMDVGGMSDTKWLLSCWEVFRVKQKYFNSYIGSFLYMLRQISAIFIQKLMKAIGLGNLLIFFKKKFKTVRHTK